MKKTIVIKQSCLNKQACRCGRFENPGTPYWLFVEGDSQAMCYECCKKEAPEMLAMCEAQNNAFWRAYQMLPSGENGDRDRLQKALDDPDNYWGQCPVCHSNDGYVNIGRGHWFFCKAHKKMWYVGSNLFDEWRHQTKDNFKSNFRLIEDFEEVEPWPDCEMNLEPSKSKCDPSDIPF